MANYGKQMEMFELGGLKDQGETIDKKSRNKVPVGSLKKEVRDDIPVNMSEGEFVLPADVVRYHGLEKIMGLRQQAKSGLDLMNDMGQMGNSHEATVPDNIPFKPNYQQGGAIVNPTIQQPEVIQQNQVPGVTYNQPAQMAMRPSIYNYAGQQPQVVKAPQVTVPTQPTYVPPQYKSPTGTAATPNYAQLVGASFGQMPKSETKRYFNKETGEEMYIPFIDGKPIYPIPAGFVEEAKAKAEEAAKDPTKSRVDTARVIEQGDDEPSITPDTQEYKIASTLASEKGGTLSKALDKITNFGMIKIAKEALKKLEPETKAPTFDTASGMYDTELDQAPSRNEAFAEQAGFKNQGTKSAYQVMSENYGVNPTFKIGTEKGDVSPITGKTYNYAGQSEDKDGSIAYSSFEDFKNAMKASAATGWYGGTMTKAEIESYTKPGGKNYDPKWDRRKIDAYNAMMGKTYNKITPEGDKNSAENNLNKGLKTDGNLKGITKEAIAKAPKTGTSFRPDVFDPKITAPVGAVRAQAKAGKDRERIINRIKKEEKEKSEEKNVNNILGNIYNIKTEGKSLSQKKNELARARADELGRAKKQDRITGFEGGQSMGDSGFDSGPTQDSDMGGMGDVGYSTAVGGFIPKRKKKKVMKRGGLASRK